MSSDVLAKPLDDADVPRSLLFHPEADHELIDAVSHYGPRLDERLQRAIEQIIQLPYTGPTWPGRPNIHRRVVPKTSYSVIYLVETDTIFVVAIEHHKRRAGYWLERL